MHPEFQYLDILSEILARGIPKKEFNSGKELKSIFVAPTMRFDLPQGFPLLTTKKVFIRGIIEELLWFVSGGSNIKFLVDRDVHIWDEWGYKVYQNAMKRGEVPEVTQEEYVARIQSDAEFAAEWGELGYVYGRLWRSWPAKNGRTIDQLKWAIEKAKNYPDRKHAVVTSWNPEYLYEMALPGESVIIPACHVMFFLNVAGGKLSLYLVQRSADTFLGVPFNIASYALLTLMLAQVCGYEPGEFVHTLVDAHLYEDHYDQARLQLTREPRPMPMMRLNPDVKNIDDFRFEDFELTGYDPHPAIKGEITVVGGFNEADRDKFAVSKK